jgi:DNA-binding MarR family transcriptional regulator
LLNDSDSASGPACILACVQATVATPQQLAHLLGVLSAHVNRTASPDMFRVLGELELSFTQMKTLFVLSEREQMSLKEVAGHLSMSLAAMSRSVDGLVQRGYVARSESASDRRSRLLTVLPAGREVLGRIMAARATALVEFASELPDDERDALHAALLPIAERISKR